MRRGQIRYRFLQNTFSRLRDSRLIRLKLGWRNHNRKLSLTPASHPHAGRLGDSEITPRGSPEEVYQSRQDCSESGRWHLSGRRQGVPGGVAQAGRASSGANDHVKSNCHPGYLLNKLHAVDWCAGRACDGVFEPVEPVLSVDHL
jgi:hypothetical protein